MDTGQADIQLFNKTNLALPVEQVHLKQVVQHIEKQESCNFSLVEVVFVDDSGIVEINKKYLDRDYITDIISFRYDESEQNDAIEGTLYCCAPRIYEQAEELNEEVQTEFLRIVIHGLLHLVGYKDSTPSQKKRMTSLENSYLSKLELT